MAGTGFIKKGISFLSSKAGALGVKKIAPELEQAFTDFGINFADKAEYNTWKKSVGSRLDDWAKGLTSAPTKNEFFDFIKSDFKNYGATPPPTSMPMNLAKETYGILGISGNKNAQDEIRPILKEWWQKNQKGTAQEASDFINLRRNADALDNELLNDYAPTVADEKRWLQNAAMAADEEEARRISIAAAKDQENILNEPIRANTQGTKLRTDQAGDTFADEITGGTIMAKNILPSNSYGLKPGQSLKSNLKIRQVPKNYNKEIIKTGVKPMSPNTGTEASDMIGSVGRAALGTAVVGAGICAALSSSRGQQNNAQLYGQQPLY